MVEPNRLVAWQIEITAESPFDITQDGADEMLRKIQYVGGAVGYQGYEMTVSLTLETPDAYSALHAAFEALGWTDGMYHFTRIIVEPART